MHVVLMIKFAHDYMSTVLPFQNKHRSSISDSTDSQLLKFGLFNCIDVPAAFEAAANIITDYASGKEVVSAVGLENAKSSLSYGIISGMSTKL